jgi:hypothetical protein
MTKTNEGPNKTRPARNPRWVKWIAKLKKNPLWISWIGWILRWVILRWVLGEWLPLNNK